MSPVNGLGFPERWLPVDGHPGYEVSDLGRIRSVDGVVYPSRTDAAKALGVRVSQVSKAIHQGHRLLGLVVTNG